MSEENNEEVKEQQTLEEDGIVEKIILAEDTDGKVLVYVDNSVDPLAGVGMAEYIKDYIKSRKYLESPDKEIDEQDES